MHSNVESVPTKLQRIAKKASTDKDCQFTSLYHLMNKELLLECFTQLKGKAASGIDNITKDQYAINLEANLENLVERLHKMAYKPQPVLRVYIPKAGSQRKRPLGIPTLEDKLVQAGLVKILQAIYEQDFLNDSYGFRPLRSCHDALRALSQTVEGQPVHYIVEADIKGFFDNVDQEQLMEFISHRIVDKRILRLIKLFEFGVFAQTKAKSRGEKTVTFDFLGFTHYNSRSRDGKRYRMKRKTVSKRFTAKVVAYKEWLKANRTLPTAEIMKTTAAKLRGHFAYYGVNDNSKRALLNFEWVK